jgi:hypothetical protein
MRNFANNYQSTTYNATTNTPSLASMVIGGSYTVTTAGTITLNSVSTYVAVGDIISLLPSSTYTFTYLSEIQYNASTNIPALATQPAGRKLEVTTKGSQLLTTNGSVDLSSTLLLVGQTIYWDGLTHNVSNDRQFCNLYTNNNFIIGSLASVYSFSSGLQNLTVGIGAGTGLVNGNYNVIIGNNSGSSFANLNNNVVLADGQGNIVAKWSGTSQAANLVMASPDGSSGPASMRALTAADLAGIDIGTASGITGGSANQILVQTAPSTTGFLTTIANGVLVSSNTGVPSFGTTLPAVNGSAITNLNASNITSGVLSLSQGGTASALSPINGAVVYSTASNLALVAVGTAGQILSSNGAGSPAWTTAKYPTGSVPINSILYASSANTITPLASVENSVLTISGAGVPQYSTTLPAVNGSAITNLNASNITSGTVPVANTTFPTQTLSGATVTLNWTTGNLFVLNLTANTTITFAGATSGQTIIVRITNTASNYTVTWSPTEPTLQWSGGVPPVMTIGIKTDIYTFIFDGIGYYGSFVQNYS